MKTGSNDEMLVGVGSKIPRWVEDVFARICQDTGLTMSAAYCTALTEVAKHLNRHWKRGPALGPFLEHLEFHSGQYNLFFETRGESPDSHKLPEAPGTGT